jgi:hypothetical protein
MAEIHQAQKEAWGEAMKASEDQERANPILPKKKR